MGDFEHLTSMKADVTNIIDFGDTPAGHRMDVYFEGELTGKLLSGRMEGIDYVSTRPDGVMQINVYATISTDDDALISVRIKGYFNPEDGSVKDDNVRFLTSHEKYKWLCNTIIVGRGLASGGVGEGTLAVDYHYERNR